MSVYEWDITVLRYDHYGTKVVGRSPAKVLAKDRNEVTEKVREMFNATYDDFRKFWSHSWSLNGAVEIQQERKNNTVCQERRVKHRSGVRLK